MTAVFFPCHATNYTAGRTKKIDRIVVHYTAGDGDTAENNGKYFMGGNRQASAHYFVDEKCIVLSVPETDTAWHAGNWDMNCRSIGVEMCSKKDGNGKYYIPQATIANAVRLVRELMAKHGVSSINVIRHYDVNGKHCPEPFVRNTAAWKEFVADISEKDTTPQQKAAEWAREAWTAAKEKGVMDGTRPLDGVTRQELAVILHRLNLF